MTARTHDVIAFASVLTVAVLYPPTAMNTSTLILCLIGTIVGSLIPDMDQAANKLWALLPGGNATARIWRHIFIKHRTITHSILGWFIIYIGLSWFLEKILNPEYVNINYVLTSIMIGYLSHLAADFVTKDGLPLFFPLDLKIGFPPIRSMRLTTGSWVEKFVVFPLVIAYICWLAYQYRDTLVLVLKT